MKGMGYGLLLTYGVLRANPPPTKLVDWKSYEILEVMGYQKYGLLEVQLYSDLARCVRGPHMVLPCLCVAPK